MEKIDVALNIFAKPYQTALSILSLLRVSEKHIGTIWLQFEPAGSRFDTISPYLIAKYLHQELNFPCVIFQPEIWFDCAVADPAKFTDEAYRLGLRFQYALEHCTSRLLFLIHNDILLHKDLLAELITNIGDAFAIGPLGQCWNCPASNQELTEQVLRRKKCQPSNYQNFQLSLEELVALYKAGDAQKCFRRTYSDGLKTIANQPWPLPECRINEWACLINLEKTKPLTIPFGQALPIGAYTSCGAQTLDIGVAWFRAMHKAGLKAKHFPTDGWLTHWVGTGHKSQVRYTQSENRAQTLLGRVWPDYLRWLKTQTKT